MTTFSESGLTFRFSKRWKVLKYDEHRFYRYLSGSGFKGVDFIGIIDEKKLALIEVKNYKDRYEQDQVDPSEALLNDPTAYATQFAHKFKDTFQLISIIRKYYQRRWWFQQPRNLLLRFIPRRFLLQFDWGFWNIVIQLIDENHEKMMVVLWLELNQNLPKEKIEKATNIIETYLQKQFPSTDAEVIIANSKSNILEIEGEIK